MYYYKMNLDRLEKYSVSIDELNLNTIMTEMIQKCSIKKPRNYQVTEEELSKINIKYIKNLKEEKIEDKDLYDVSFIETVCPISVIYIEGILDGNKNCLYRLFDYMEKYSKKDVIGQLEAENKKLLEEYFNNTSDQEDIIRLIAQNIKKIKKEQEMQNLNENKLDESMYFEDIKRSFKIELIASKKIDDISFNTLNENNSENIVRKLSK